MLVVGFWFGVLGIMKQAANPQPSTSNQNKKHLNPYKDRLKTHNLQPTTKETYHPKPITKNLQHTTTNKNTMVTIKIKNTGRQALPAYATSQSAGMDLRADISEPFVLRPLQRRLVPTGLHIALPEGYEAQVRPRSGLALKHGVTVLNTPGTIDADYRGEIGVVLVNLSDTDFVVNPGERIAQMVVARYEQAELLQVDELDETERGEGGYGHTGVR